MLPIVIFVYSLKECKNYERDTKNTFIKVKMEMYRMLN